MLRRNNSSRVSRRKSTSSVHSKHDSIDPEVARRHAHAAATLAFARAEERHKADVGRSAAGAPKNPPPASQQQQRNDKSYDVDPVIRRQQSVRFAGPNAVPSRHFGGGRISHAGTNHSQVLPQKTSATLRPMAMTTNAPVPAAYRPPSRSSSIGKGSISKATAENLAIVNGAYNEYYTLEDDVASTPSSYRRIRRSKSMFSPLKAPSIFYTNGTPERPEVPPLARQNSFLASRASQDRPSGGALRAPKSMSFLREGRGHMSTSLRERNDAAVQLARDRFFSQTTQQRLREQPSFLFRIKAQRQEKAFRKSARSSSANSYGMPISSDPERQATRESSFRETAREASRTLRSKFKRVFGRSKDEPVEIPNQQVDAKETHVRHYLGNLPVGQFSKISHPDEASLSRVSARVPSLHAAESNQQLRSHAGSVRSVKSFATDNSDNHASRVTSWNSTGVNTLASQTARAQAAEREQQRLSIIAENGAHISSSSFKGPTLKNQFSAYPLLERPEPAPVPNLLGPVDSARVYSALMKRLDENSPDAKRNLSTKQNGPRRKHSSSNVSENAPRKSNQFPAALTEREAAIVKQPPLLTSSASSGPATIRCVAAQPSASSSESEHDHEWMKACSSNLTKSDDVFGYGKSQVHQWVTGDSVGTNSSNKENIPVKYYQQSDSSASYHTFSKLDRPSPQEMALKNELLTLPGAKVLRDSRSAFFGGTSAITISRTPSPFRRALAEAERDSRAFTSQPYAPRRLSPLRNPLFSSRSSSEENILERNAHIEPEVAYSESIYSRTTSGHTPELFGQLSQHGQSDLIGTLPLPSSVPLGYETLPMQNESGNGDVVIIDSTTYRPLMTARRDHGATGSMGSAEWKKWMSSEVAKLERAKDGPIAGGSFVNYALPTMPKSFHPGHHVRENAQIHDDDPKIVQARIPAVKQPLGIIPQNPNISQVPSLRPIVPKRSSSSLSNHVGVKSNPQQVPGLHHESFHLRPILKHRSTSSLNENAGINSISSVPMPPPPPPPPPPMPPIRPIRPTLRLIPSKSSMRSVVTVNSASSSIPPKSAGKIASLSGRGGGVVLHKNTASSTTLRSAAESTETSAKLVKRSVRPAGNQNSSSAASPPSGSSQFPQLPVRSSDNVRHFGSNSSKSRSPARHNNNSNNNRENAGALNDKVADDIYGSEGAGLMGPPGGSGVGSGNGSSGRRGVVGVGEMSEGEVQSLGSKRMVDLFLSSRRKRIASASDEGSTQIFL